MTPTSVRPAEPAARGRALALARRPLAWARQPLALVRRPLAWAEGLLAALVYWQAVSRTIEDLLQADDAQLRAMGLERNQIVPWVLQKIRQRHQS